MHRCSVRSLQFMFIPIMHTACVQKHNQLQTLVDAALQSQTDQDVEHKYDDKVWKNRCEGRDGVRMSPMLIYVCM